MKGEKMKINNFYSLLKNIGIFRTFNEKQIENIFSKIHYQIKDYPKNELVFFRGDTINHIIIILEGLCKGEMQKLNGDSIVIDYIPSQQIVAPAFIFGDVSTFPVDLITVEKTKLLFLDKNDFLELLQTDKTLLINFINEISNKGQLLSKRIWFNFTNKIKKMELSLFIQIFLNLQKNLRLHDLLYLVRFLHFVIKDF